MKAEHLGADCQNCPLRDAGFVPTQHPQGRPLSVAPDSVLRGEVLDASGKVVLGERKIAVVGEAPGFVETTYQKPFTGPSGKLLTSVLNHHGIRRSEVLLTNVCLCRPQDNATPPKAAIAACKPRLARELTEFGCTDILALGGTAGTLLVDNPGTITTLRIGPPKPLARWVHAGQSVLDGCHVIPTWHPAYCLRNADAFPALVTDVGKLKESNSEPWTEPEWRAADDPAHALQVIGRLQSLEGPLVLDIEVGFDKDEAFDHPNNYALLCVGIAYERGRAVVLGRRALADDAVVDGLRKLFRETPSGAPRKLIAHNGKFDLAGLYPVLGPLELWFDTMLASYCLDERPGNHGLKVLAVEKLGAPKYDDEIRKYIPRKGNYADIPEPILHKYNAYDVACTWALYEMFEESLTRTRMREVHDFLVKASNQLMYLELNGIAIDREYSNQLQSEYLARLEVIEAELDDIIRQSTGHIVDEEGELVWQKGINPRSPIQVKKYLDTQGVRVASTNEATLTVLLKRLPERAPCSRFVATLLRYRRQQKLYSTYIVGIRKRMYRGRIYTTYLLHGSTSGRLASRNPNLQNIVRDKEIRRQFSVSKPGNVFVQCDYKQAEARVMTFLAQDEYLREILSRQEPGYDFFNELSDQLYGVGNWKKEVERIRTKAFFYGIGYGREPYSIAQEYGMTPAEATRRYDAFMNLIPGIVAWQHGVQEHVLSGKPLITPFGRRRRFWLITEQNKKDVLNEALSYLPQSTASDICLRALIRLRPMLRGLGFLRLTIHDALVAECTEERQDEVSRLLAEVMAEEGRRFTDYVPWPVDISVGKSWGDL
jgi:uracil-DNA glycosylase family 4